MAVDPNVYAINMQLSLDIEAATRTLTEFEDKISSIEEKISDSLSKAFFRVNDIIKQVDISLTGVLNRILNINTGSTEFVDYLSKINEASSQSITNNNITSEQFEKCLQIAKDMFGVDEKTNKAVTDRISSVEDLLKVTETLLESQRSIDTSFQEQLKSSRLLHSSMASANENVSRSLTGHIELYDKNVQMLEAIRQAISSKNVGHVEEQRLVTKEAETIESLNVGIRKQRDGVYDVAGAWSHLLREVKNFFSDFKKLDEGTEQFRQTNYRAYGSQQLLLLSSRDLTTELGVSQKKAVEIYKALIDLKAPAEELEKYAESIAKVNRTTGVGVQTLAAYTTRMRTFGLTADPLDEHLADVTEQMRKMGLATDDINRLMTGTINNQIALMALFGKNVEQMKQFELANAALIGVAKSAGLSTDAVSTMQKQLSSPEGWVLLSRFSGMSVNDMDSYKVAMLSVGQQLSILQDQMNAAVDPMIKNQLQQRLESLSESFLGERAAGYAVIEMYKQATKEAGHAANSVEDYDRVMRTMANDTESQYYESLNTLYGAIKVLSNAFYAAWQSAVTFIGDGMIPLLEVIGAVVTFIANMVTGIISFVNWIEETIPIIGNVVTVIKVLTAMMVMYYAATIAAAGGLGVFMSALLGLQEGHDRIRRTFEFTTNMLLEMARVAGRATVIMFQSLGRGLYHLGNSVATVKVELLTIGLAFAMAGAGAYMFTQAIQTLVDIGPDALAAGAGLLLFLGLAGLGLIGLGAMAEAVAPGLLVLGASMLMVGAAAFAFGAGIDLAGEGLKKISKSITLEFVTLLPSLAVGLLQLGLAALVAGPGLLVLGSGMFMLGAGAEALSVGVVGIVQIIELIESGKIQSAAEKFVDSFSTLMAAAGAAVVVGATLAAAGFILLPAAYVLSMVGDLILPAAESMSKLVEAMSNIKIIASDIPAIKDGLIMLSSLGAPMIKTGSDLIIGATLLGYAISPLVLTGTAIKSIGSDISEGVDAIASGLSKLKEAMSDVSDLGASALAAAEQISTASIVLLRSSIQLFNTGLMMTIASSSISSGSIAMITASTLLTLAAVSLTYSTAMLGVTSTTAMINFSIFNSASYIFLNGANNIAISSKLMSEAAILLGSAVGQLRNYGSSLVEAGSSLKDGATSLMLASSTINSANSVMKNVASGIKFTSDLIGDGLSRIELSVSRFARASEQVRIVGFGMLSLAAAFQILNNINMNNFRSTMEGVSDTIPIIGNLAESLQSTSSKLNESFSAISRSLGDFSVIDEMSTKLASVSKRFSESANNFSKPANDLAVSINRLSESITNLNRGFQLSEDITIVSEQLDNYATRLEDTAKRVQNVLDTRVVPAMVSTQSSGRSVGEAAIAPITPVVVMTSSESDQKQSNAEYIMYSQLSTMQKLVEIVASATGETKSEYMSEIVNLLRAYLPDLNKRDSSLSSDLNGWS